VRSAPPAPPSERYWLQEMVYHRKTFTSVQELKRAIVTAWLQQLSQAFLDRSIGEWRRRLENVVQCNGGHIEHVY